MRDRADTTARYCLWAIAVLVMVGGMADAGGIGWAAPATDVSGSLQAAAGEFMPFVISGGALAAGFYLQNMLPAVIGMVGSLYVASNSDEVAGVIGTGGGGGLITETVYISS